MTAPYLLKNGGAVVYKKGTTEELGHVYAEELPGGNGQMQRWLLTAVPGEYDIGYWDGAPDDLEHWEAMVPGMWTSGAFYIIAKSTVLRYTQGMNVSQAIWGLEPQYPSLPDQLAIPNDTRGPQNRRPAPRPPHHPPHLAAHPPRKGRQLVIGDKWIVQPGLVGYCFGNADVEDLAEKMTSFTGDEYWLLADTYQSMGGTTTTVIRNPLGNEQNFDTLANFKQFAVEHFGTDHLGTTFNAYEVTGCHYYQGESVPTNL